MATIQENIAKKKAGTASTEVIVGAGAAAIARATTAFTAAINAATSAGQTVLQDLTEQSSRLSLEIAGKEDQLTAITVEVSEKKRAAKVEVELAYKADAAAAAQEYADENDKTLIDNRVYQIEQESYQKLQDNYASDLAKGIGAATATQKKEHESAIQLLQANFKAQEANNQAQLSVLAQQLTDAREETKRAWDALAAERQAGVERAKAQGSSTVNVGAPTR